MKKLVCSAFGTIYWAKILKNGLMSSEDRTEVTDDALNAVIQHFLCQPDWKDGFAGYTYDKTAGGKITLSLIDNDKYEIVKRYE